MQKSQKQKSAAGKLQLFNKTIQSIKTPHPEPHCCLQSGQTERLITNSADTIPFTKYSTQHPPAGPVHASLPIPQLHAAKSSQPGNIQVKKNRTLPSTTLKVRPRTRYDYA